MELNFKALRVATLVFLMAGFAVLGGFSLPVDLPSPMVRSWALMILLFTVSAISTTVVDHWIGSLERSNLRWFYIVVGIAGMVGALTLMHVLKEGIPAVAS